MSSRLGAAIGLAAALALPLASLAEACTPPNRSTLLILDLSDSMIAKVPSGEARIDVARTAVQEVVKVYPPEAKLALRVYGADSPYSQMDCKDSRLLVPFGAAAEDSQAILDAVFGVRAQGMTPIGFSLDQGARDFANLDEKDRAIVVVSDGRETCNANPCGVASMLAAQGFVIHAVGLVVDKTAALQLKCLATVSGGTYVDVPNALELPDKLRDLFAACKISMLSPAEPRRIAGLFTAAG